MRLINVIVVVTVFLFASSCGILRGQIPISPQNRIVDGKLYNPQKSALWIDVSRDVTERCSKLQVTGVGKISIGCAVYRDELDDGGRWGVYKVIGEEYVKNIIIYNHPAHNAMTTGLVIRPGRGEISNHPARDAMIFAPRTEKDDTSPAAKPFLAMRVENWHTNGLSLEAYDCGLPDTVENRRKAGIPVPTFEEITAAKGTTAAANKVKTAEAKAKALEWNQEQADKGDAIGLLRMGERYRDGEGVEKDLNKSHDYLTKAAAAGSPTAADELSKLNQVSTNSPTRQ